MELLPEKKESDVKHNILLQLGGDGDCIVWNHPTGVARSLQPPYQHVQYGRVGSPDVIGCVRITITPDMVGREIGVAVGIETKHPKTGGQREQQARFQRAFEARGGIYILTRTAKNIKDIILEKIRNA